MWGMCLLVRTCRSKEITRDYVVIKHSSIIHECSQWQVHWGHYSLLNFWQEEGTNPSVYWTSSIGFCLNTHKNTRVTHLHIVNETFLREKCLKAGLHQFCVQLIYRFFFNTKLSHFSRCSEMEQDPVYTPEGHCWL